MIFKPMLCLQRLYMHGQCMVWDAFAHMTCQLKSMVSIFTSSTFRESPLGSQTTALHPWPGSWSRPRAVLWCHKNYGCLFTNYGWGHKNCGWMIGIGLFALHMLTVAPQIFKKMHGRETRLQAGGNLIQVVQTDSSKILFCAITLLNTKCDHTSIVKLSKVSVYSHTDW